MRGAFSGRSAATALLFATAFAFAVVAISSGVVVDAGCPFLELQGKNWRLLFRRRERERDVNVVWIRSSAVVEDDPGRNVTGTRRPGPA